MSYCSNCRGLIAEPGKVYGNAGEWCYCAPPTRDSWPVERSYLPYPVWPVQPEPHKPVDLDKLIDYLNLPRVFTAPEPERTMTPTEFASWLDGVNTALAGANPSQALWQKVLAQSKLLVPPPPTTIPLGAIKRTPSGPVFEVQAAPIKPVDLTAGPHHGSLK